MATLMKQRRGTAVQWSTINPVLADGEIGFTTDTRVVKIGDGVTAWNSLAADFLTRSIMDATGDLLVGAGADSVTRLARGTTGQQLAVKADGTLEWVNPFAVVDSAEDLIVGTGADAVKRLAKGSVGQRLTISAAGAVAWEALPAAANPFTVIDALGDILVGSGPDAVARLAKGANNSILVVNSAGTVTWLVKGTNGQVLTIDGSGNLSWATPAAADLSTRVAKTGDTMTGRLTLKEIGVSDNGNLLLRQTTSPGAYAGLDAGAVYDTGNRVYSASNPPPVSGMSILGANKLSNPSLPFDSGNPNTIQNEVSALDYTFVAPANGRVVIYTTATSHLNSWRMYVRLLGVTSAEQVWDAFGTNHTSADLGMTGEMIYTGLTPGAIYTVRHSETSNASAGPLAYSGEVVSWTEG